MRANNTEEQRQAKPNDPPKKGLPATGRVFKYESTEAERKMLDGMATYSKKWMEKTIEEFKRGQNSPFDFLFGGSDMLPTWEKQKPPDTWFESTTIHF